MCVSVTLHNSQLSARTTLQTPMRNRISGEELHRVLDRARVKDALGEKIEKAIELIDGVLEDLG